MNKKQRCLIFALIYIACLFYFTGNFQRIAIPGAIFDLLGKDLGVTAHYITAFGAIFMYVYALGQLVAGVLVDRYGGMRIIACGGIIFTLGCLLFPITDNLYLMYFSRALLGFGSSMFYLSLVKELKNLYSDKDYGIALSVMLFIGYVGGIVANAPFVALIHYMSWQEILLIVAGVMLVALIVFFIILGRIELPAINKHVKFSVLPFKRVLHKKHNRNLFTFAGCNFGISYVIQTIIGKKFLEDFCLCTVHEAAMFLSIMAVAASVFNIINASVCKLCHNHRVIFLKTAAVVTFISLLTICLLIYFDIRTMFIGFIFLVLAGNASITSILIPVIQQSNNNDISVTAVSIMNFCFFMMVGILGTATGFILHLFEPQNINGVMVFGRESYLTLFTVFFLLSVFELYKAAKLSNHY